MDAMTDAKPTADEHSHVVRPANFAPLKSTP